MSLHSGAAIRNISPTDSVQLCGYPHVRRIATDIHDPLLASVLYLRNETSAVLLGALDLIMLNCDVARRIRRSIARAMEIPEACVLLSCTHTHSGPVTLDYLPFSGDIAMPAPDPKYLEFVECRILEAALAAKQNTHPAQLAWSVGNAAGVGGNRHARDGITDSEVGVLTVQANGKALAVALIYGMHPTVLHEDSLFVSGDFPHYARVQVREALGEDVVVLYHTGPAGNQSPRYHVNGQTFTEAERLGRKLGSAALQGATSAQFSDDIPLSGWLKTVELTPRKLPSVADAEKLLTNCQSEFARLKTSGAERAQVRTAEVAVFGAEAQLNLARAKQSGELDHLLARIQPFEAQVLRIGDACVAALPGEIFTEFGLELKRRTAMKSFVVTYANGELQGYIVTPEAAASGGYEAASSLFPPAAGTALIEECLSAISNLKGASR